MLAVKGVLASRFGAGTVVFDEIDANIGGETGRAVGARMRELAKSRQIVAITHLPQSAVFADTHLVVVKDSSETGTKSRVGPVEGEKRVSEIARMLGGGKAAETHAAELLESSARQSPAHPGPRATDRKNAKQGRM